MKITNIKTQTGNTILDALKKDGWKQTQEYSPLAFDKGIDFDSYTLKKAGETLAFEWTNWFEWEISGSTEVIENLVEKYGLEGHQ